MMVLNNRSYDVGKYVAQIVLPGLGTLYFALSQIWGLPKGEEIVGTITAVDAFMGLVLGLSSAVYNRTGAGYGGIINVEQKPGGGKMFSLELHSDPDKLEEKKDVTFKVQSS